MKFNLHSVFEIAEKEVDKLVSDGLAELLKVLNSGSAEVTHVESVLTTDSGPRKVAPTSPPETPKPAPETPEPGTPGPSAPAASTTSEPATGEATTTGETSG